MGPSELLGSALDKLIVYVPLIVVPAATEATSLAVTVPVKSNVAGFAFAVAETITARTPNPFNNPTGSPFIANLLFHFAPQSMRACATVRDLCQIIHATMGFIPGIVARKESASGTKCHSKPPDPL